MKLPHLFRSILLFFGILSFALSPAHALDGVRIGDCYTTEDGVNHCGGGTSSGSSSYGWTYTYGYTNGSAQSSGPTWAERAEARRMQEEAEALAAVQREAVRVNELGVEASKRGDWQAALYHYEQAHAINPSDPVIADNVRSAKGTGFNEEANQAYERGDFATAVETYRKALELKPESDVIRQNLADAESQLQNERNIQAAEQESREHLAQAGEKMKQSLSGFTLNSPKENNSPVSSSPGSLTFKDTRSAKPSAWEQLKYVWTKGNEAKDEVDPEEASSKARQGFDTPEPSVVDLRDKKGIVNTDVLQFKPAASAATAPVKDKEYEELLKKARSLPEGAGDVDIIHILNEGKPVDPSVASNTKSSDSIKENEAELLAKARSLPEGAENFDIVQLLQGEPAPAQQPSEDIFMKIVNEQFENSQKEKK